MVQPIRFAINRICASRLPLPAFAAMACRLGVTMIELRNDLNGVETRDGTPAGDILAITRDHGLTIRSINALQRFDQWDAARAHEATELMRQASACNAQAIVLCPTNSRQDTRSGAQRQDDLLLALQQILPLLQSHGLTGLIEPLGFAECTLRYKSRAQHALRALGSPASLQLVHDSFHHHLAGEDGFFAADTGLVHVSGVDDPLPARDAMRDAHRVLVGPHDRLDTVGQLRTLLAGGYRGAVSFEPFADAVITADDIERQLARSMAYLSAAVAASTGADGNSVR